MSENAVNLRRAQAGNRRFSRPRNSNPDPPSSPYLVSASCNFLFGSNRAGAASPLFMWGRSFGRHSQSRGGAAPFLFGVAVTRWRSRLSMTDLGHRK
jgi:hypothetical protein